MTSRSWDTGVWIADSRRIRTELGWEPTVDFEAGFRKQVEWFRANPSLWPLYEAIAARRSSGRLRWAGASKG